MATYMPIGKELLHLADADILLDYLQTNSEDAEAREAYWLCIDLAGLDRKLAILPPPRNPGKPERR